MARSFICRRAGAKTGPSASLLAAALLVVVFQAIFPSPVQSATTTFNFTYASRSALLADGWSFVATLPGGIARNTEITNAADGAVVSYDQTAHPGVLQVPVDVGDVWAGANNTRNSLFRAVPVNWVSLRFEFSMAPAQNYEQANLTLYQDDDNYVSISQTFNGTQKITMAREFSGYPLETGQAIVAPTNVFLRLDRNISTDNITGFYSLDGTNWVFMGVISQALVSTRIGLWAGGATVPWTNGATVAGFQRLDIVTSDNYVPPKPTLVLQPQHLIYNAIAGQPLTNLRQLHVVQLRGQDPPIHWTLTNNTAWLRSSLASGATPSACNLSVDTTGLAAGRYDATLTCGAPGATAGVATVTLLLNPPGRARVAVWHGASSGAFSVCVDDSFGTAFDDLSTNGLTGTYYGVGFTAQPFYTSYYQAGMELGSHTVDHPCYNVLSEPLLRYEIEANVSGLCSSAAQPCEQFISFAWPCGTTDPKMESITADYFLSARGYNLNQLEDTSPVDFMNLKSFNTHGDLVPPPVADFKTMVDAAIAQGKWLNMVLHGVLVDDGAILYSVGQDVWGVSQGTVVKYILQRDRTIITNYTEANGSISFQYLRLPVDPSSHRVFENAFLPQDTLTMQVDITGLPVIYGLTVNGASNSYTTKIVGAKTLLLWDSGVTGTAQTALIQGPTNTAPVLPAQPNLVVNELVPLTVTNTATDPDAGQTLVYSLVNPPAGAQIDANGIISWTPGEAQGSTTFTLTTVVTDNGVPSLSATNSFTVSVTDVNFPPSLPPQPDRTIYGPVTLVVTNTATDADIPPGPLTYQLLQAPPSATIDSNGVITWVVQPPDVPSTNIFTTVATDYHPLAVNQQSLSSTNSFTVIVAPAIAPVLLTLPNVVVNEGQSFTVTNTCYDATTVGQWNTNTIQFNYANRAAFVGDGWSFIATAPGGAPRNTEITNPADPAILSYNQNAHPGVLRLPCDVGDLWANLNTSTNNVFRNLPAGWRSLRLTLAFAPILDVEQTHLAIYQDDDNYEQVGLAYNSNLGGEVATVIQETNGTPQHTAVVVNSITNVQLRLDNSPTDGSLTGLFSTDGTNWTTIASYTPSFTNPRLGIWAGGSPVPFTNGLPTVDLRRLDLITSNVVSTSLSYFLLNPPSGATIDNNGVIRWTPGFYQGPSTNVITTVAIDSAVPPRSATNSFLVVVQEVNIPPVLPLQTNQTINELTTLVVNNSAIPNFLTNTFQFTYATRADLLSAGWSFVGRTATGAPRNTEITNPAVGAVVSYDQTVHPGTLRIPCDTGDMFGNLNNTRNTLFRNLSSNWTSMRLNLSFAPTQNFQQSHLSLYQDDDNYVHMTMGYNSGRNVNITQEISGSQATLNRTSFAGTNIWLRLDRDLGTGNLTGYYSTDGANWTSLGGTSQSLINPELAIWCGGSSGGFPNVDLSTLIIIETNAALRALDVPGETFTYTLLSAPAGAVIDANGIITWTPGEGQGPSTNIFTTVVSNYNPYAINNQTLSATNSFVVIVNDVNIAPVLPAQPDLVVSAGTTLTVTNTATDSDIPSEPLTYQLTQAPAGATISTNGVITWTPANNQAGTTNLFQTVVTDYNPSAVNAQQLSATNSFRVTVNATHTGPVLPVQPDQTIAEQTTLVVTNTAADSDVPALTLTYQLVSPPAGAMIDTNGVITWTPSEAQGPSTNVVTTVVTDNGAPPLSATNSFNIFVQEINLPPVLPVQQDMTVSGEVTVTVTNTATDPDIPANPLIYQLTVAPAGASIDTNGVITWTVQANQVPSANVFQTVVTDYNPWAVNAQHLSATNSFRVVVNAIHNGPALPVQADQTIAELTTLTITNTAIDSDVPALTLSYQLISPADGATIDTNGVITWTPSEAQGPSTNVLTTVVSDNGTPSLSATNSFTVVVQEINLPPVLSAQLDVTAAAGSTVTVTNTATDPDIPANPLTYQLTIAPAGATIDTNGVITWPIPPNQAPGTNLFETIVTDYNPWAVNEQHLSATNSFNVVVNNVHNGPVLSAQLDLTIAEQTTLTVTNTASDADVPPPVLTYMLLQPPAGATIDTNGIIIWTPSEAQGPSTNVITTVVSDNGTPPLSATNSFTVVVEEINLPPVLPFQPDITISANMTLVVTNIATDPDIPANPLTYQLTIAPTGAVIDATGVITWTNVAKSAPSTNLFQTVVTDYNPWAVNAQHLSATNGFTVIVNAIHNGPVLLSVASQTVTALATLRVTNTATDSDLPPLALTYVLVNPPAGATIDTNGIITWTPTQGPSTNLIVTLVTDSGFPPISASNGFTVTVLPVVQPFHILSITVSNGLAAISWEAVAGQSYRVQYNDDLGSTVWTDATGDVVAVGATASASVSVGPESPQRLFRVITTQLP